MHIYIYMKIHKHTKHTQNPCLVTFMSLTTKGFRSHSTSLYHKLCISLLGLPLTKYHTKTGWLKQQKCFLQFWKLEIQDQGISRFGLQVAFCHYILTWSSHCVHTSLMSLCVSKYPLPVRHQSY